MRRAWALAALIALAAPAFADSDAPLPPVVVGNGNVVAASHPVVITQPGHRSSYNKQFIAGLAGVGVVLAGVGLFYNLDSEHTANTISAAGPTGQPWTTGDQSQYDYNHELRTRAIAFYSVGGAVLIGAIVAWIVTAPRDEHIVIQPRVTPMVTPAPGGAMLGGSLRF